jgi:DNA polymerase III sliding clamp (beta) subunit (PCNA family)
MDTVRADKVTSVDLNYIELEGATLLELLEGVSTHADKDKGRQVLNALQVEGEGGLFIARATDRYRLIEGSIKALNGQLDPAIISLEDTKRLIALLKSHKAHLISLTRMGNALTVSALGDSITFTLVDGNYPPTAELLSKVESDPIAVEGVAFNPVFFNDYAKIAGKGAAIKVYFGGEGKPMRVRITGDKIIWRALLMPMRYAD